MSLVVFCALGAVIAADAGHRGEDSIQEIWLEAERARDVTPLAEAPVTSPEVIAIPASVEWIPKD